MQLQISHILCRELVTSRFQTSAPSLLSQHNLPQKCDMFVRHRRLFYPDSVIYNKKVSNRKQIARQHSCRENFGESRDMVPL